MTRPRRNDLHQLDVYRCALELYMAITRMVDRFPRGEADLRSQMRRAARSVPFNRGGRSEAQSSEVEGGRSAPGFNIGEGVGKRGKARAAAYEVALGETKELIVALDCVEIDGLVPLEDIVLAQDLADRSAAMLTKLIRSAHWDPVERLAGEQPVPSPDSNSVDRRP